jgi:hypothetical protein
MWHFILCQMSDTCKGRCHSLDSFLKITEVAHIFVLLYSTVNFSCIDFYKKMGWATFLAIYSQPHLVTLIKATAHSIAYD